MLRVCFNIIPLNSGFLFYFLSDWRQEALSQQSGDQSDPTPAVASSLQPDELSLGRDRKLLRLAMLAIMMFFQFLYVGLEVAFGTFLTTFAVKSKLGGCY